MSALPQNLSRRNVKAALTPALACLRRLIEHERERLEQNTTRMQRARSLLANFTHQINSSIASPEREVVCT